MPRLLKQEASLAKGRGTGAAGGGILLPTPLRWRSLPRRGLGGGILPLTAPETGRRGAKFVLSKIFS